MEIHVPESTLVWESQDLGFDLDFNADFLYDIEQITSPLLISGPQLVAGGFRTSFLTLNPP